MALTIIAREYMVPHKLELPTRRNCSGSEASAHVGNMLLTELRFNHHSKTCKHLVHIVGNVLWREHVCRGLRRLQGSTQPRRDGKPMTACQRILMMSEQAAGYYLETVVLTRARETSQTGAIHMADTIITAGCVVPLENAEINSNIQQRSCRPRRLVRGSDTGRAS